MTYESERSVAVDAVLKACSLCQEVRSSLCDDEACEKEDRSPVTIADFGAQAVVSYHLRESFPNDPLVAEEDSRILRQSENAHLSELVVNHVRRIVPDLGHREVLEAIDRGSGKGGPKGRFWTLDPIDGTKGFLRADQYAVALALVEDGQVTLGVLGCPNLPLNIDDPTGPRGCLFVAVKGEGTIMQAFDDSEKRTIHVAGGGDSAGVRFCESFESSHTSHERSARMAQLLSFSKEPLRIDSQCKYGVVARGDAAVYLRLPTGKSYMETIWDHAAGSIVVQEAGGKVTDMEGKPLDFSLGRTLSNNRGIVVTNGGLHQSVLTAAQEVYQST